MNVVQRAKVAVHGIFLRSAWESKEKKEKRKVLWVKCEGRDLGSEGISEFRPSSQLRLIQAAMVFQDKLLERGSDRQVECYLLERDGDSPRGEQETASSLLQLSREWEKTWTYWGYSVLWGDLMKLIGDTL